jgi:glycosyltransferase involved in cell wall biosynthesis
MRGFWADERVEGGIWDTKRWLYRRAYEYYKKQELRLLNQSDQIVVLTHAAKEFLIKNKLTSRPITVIPCCVDEEKFNPNRFFDDDRNLIRQQLNIPLDAPVLVYVGSLGTWYMLEEMKSFFQTFILLYPNAHFLILTKDTDTAHKLLYDLHSQVRIISVNSADVPKYLYAMDYGIFFIRPSFSKTGSSPIKLAELWAMNKPVFCNGDYGDMDYLWEKYQLPGLIHNFTNDDYYTAIQSLVSAPIRDFRAIGHEVFALDRGVEAYHRIYETLKA